jgi:hypothetical protein
MIWCSSCSYERFNKEGNNKSAFLLLESERESM